VNLIYAKRKVFVKLNNDGNENEKAKSLERRLRSLPQQNTKSIPSISLRIMPIPLMALDMILPSLIPALGANLQVFWYLIFLCVQWMSRPVMSIQVF
jgi:hypothetical protein